MEETLIDLFKQPFVIGLSLGFVVALYVWLRAIGKARVTRLEAAARMDGLRAEIETLKAHLHTQMEITAKGNSSLKDELTALEKTNHNLSQTIGALKQKPGRAEIRTLHLYDKAIRIMNARAPGFGSAWESAVNDAEAEIQKEESGLLGWMRKPFMFRKAPATTLLADTDTVNRDLDAEPTNRSGQ